MSESDDEWPDDDWSDDEYLDVGPSERPTARAATVVGLLGVGSLPGMLFCGLGALLAVLALAMAPSAQRQVLESDGQFGGLGLIRAARICSILSLLIAVVMAIGLALAYSWLIDYARDHNGN
jgi:hypothetical protein